MHDRVVMFYLRDIIGTVTTTIAQLGHTEPNFEFNKESLEPIDPGLWGRLAAVCGYCVYRLARLVVFVGEAL